MIFFHNNNRYIYLEKYLDYNLNFLYASQKIFCVSPKSGVHRINLEYKEK